MKKQRKNWPSSYRVFKDSLGSIAEHFGTIFFLLLGQVFVLFFAQAILSAFSPSSGALVEVTFWPAFISGMLLYLYGAFFFLVLVHLLEKGTKATRMSISEFLKPYLSLVVLFFLLLLVFVIASAFLVIPAVILIPFWGFAVYILVLERRTIIGSIKRSQELVSGFWWNVFHRLLFLMNVSIVISFFRIIPGPGATTFALLSLFYTPLAVFYMGRTYLQLTALSASDKKKLAVSTGNKVLLVLWAIIALGLLALFTALGDFVVQTYALSANATFTPLNAFGG